MAKLIGIAVALSAIACLYTCTADVGTATSYGPPYIPTACYGNDEGQFPFRNLFAAASDGIWNAGAACGTKFAVRCLGGTDPTAGKPCKHGTIIVKIVDNCTPDCPGTLALSEDAFADIANSTIQKKINVEYYAADA